MSTPSNMSFDQASNGVATDIAVIVPTFNDGQFLKRCLLSIVSQSLRPTEVIVIDDGTTHPLALAGIEDAKISFPHVTFVRQANAGPSAARNLGLARCSGQYIAFVDADDELLSDSLCKRRKLFQEHQDIVASYAGVCFVEPNGKRKISSYRIGCGSLAVDQIGNRDGVPGFVWAYLIRRDALLAVGGFNEALTIMEDFDLLARLGRSKGVFVGIADPAYVQHRQQNSLSRASAGRQAAGALRFLAEARRQKLFGPFNLLRRYARVPFAALKILILYKRS